MESSSDKTSKFVAHLLNSFKISDSCSNEENQKRIETIIIDEFDSVFSNNKTKYIVGGVNTDLLNTLLNKYIISKETDLRFYISNLIDSSKDFLKDDKTTRLDKALKAKVIISNDKDLIFNLCLLHFLLIYTYQNSDNDTNNVLLPLSIGIGKKMFNRYLNNTKSEYLKTSGDKISFSLWADKWKADNIAYSKHLDDNLYTSLGCDIIQILESCDMIKKVLTTTVVDYNKVSSQYSLVVLDDSKLSRKNKHVIINMPTKLPMIVKPKPYTKDALGGYLLNDVKFSEGLFIEKKAYSINSVLSDCNKIYDMINKISSTPFKINETLLNYLIANKHNLLIDSTVSHKFADLKKRTRPQEKEYASYNSKVILQETILGISQFYSRFNEIYFPVRLDQTGRLYCSPNYLNYQSNELSKALILFSKPGIIKKGDTECIAYLKGYGANCYGGIISKKSLNSKLEWVDENLYDIVNYDNGVLLNKAKDKLLFLSFCMEYKRFYDFYTNENTMEFDTFLPVQLDATCNGFQHLALLSNEVTLFKELNLITASKAKGKELIDNQPSDFYNFLLHKLINLFETKLSEGEIYDVKTNGSYDRLSKFIWDRSYIKKTIMTIPYNSSPRSMKYYLAECLVRLDKGKQDETWYSDSIKNTKIVINESDLWLLIKSLKFIMENDFEKIKKLIKYLKNVAVLLNMLELPISWTLPSGLTIKQSYLETKSTSIAPFMHSKIKLNLKVTVKDKFDKKKQVRALMPNLIHSLDATSLSLLYEQFSFNSDINDPTQFFSVHDCFGTTCEKVFRLKTILASVYTDLYSRDPYLCKFDQSIFDSIEASTNYKLDRVNRTVDLTNGKYTIHDIEWVLNKKQLSSKIIKRIDCQHILI